MTIILDKKRLKLWDLNDYYNLYSKSRDYRLLKGAPLLIHIGHYYIELESLVRAVPQRFVPLVTQYICAVRNGTLDLLQEHIKWRVR